MAKILQILMAATCDFCGQELVDADAVNHYHERMATFAETIKRQAEHDALENAKADVAAQLEAANAKFLALREKHKTLRSQVRTAERAKLDRKYADRLKSTDATLRLLKRQNEELRRRVEKLSAPEQGERYETSLADRLRAAFPDDEIELRGKNGDVLQTVFYVEDGQRQAAGVIVYECKDTLKWSNDFVRQARKAGQHHRTPYVLLVTSALPGRERAQVCVRDGVVILQPVAALDLAEIIRSGVISTHKARLTIQERDAKTARLFDYLSSEEFGQEIEGLVADSTVARSLLDQEQGWHAKNWQRRDEIYGRIGRRASGIDARVRTIIESTGLASTSI